MIIYNALKLPEPIANISRVGFSWPTPKEGYWHIHAAASLPPDIDGKKYASKDAAISAAIDAGYRIADEQPKSASWAESGSVLLIHTETQQELEKILAKSRDKWSQATPCYVRYGDLPENGRSTNHADGSLEDGVSVFYGETLPSGEARPLPKRQEQIAGAFILRSRPLYIVEGEEIGTGSDGEPLLKDCKIIREAK